MFTRRQLPPRCLTDRTAVMESMLFCVPAPFYGLCKTLLIMHNYSEYLARIQGDIVMVSLLVVPQMKHLRLFPSVTATL